MMPKLNRRVLLSFSAFAWSLPLAAGTGQQSFTPSSFKIPVTALVLQGAGGSPSSQVYQCTPSASDNCEVDILDTASVAALQTRLGASSVSAGTYTQVWFNCSTGQSAIGSTGYLKFKGTATSGTTTYYTASGDNPVTSDASHNDYVTTNVLGCGSTHNLPQPLVVKDGDPGVTISLFVNQSMNAWFDPHTSGGMGGCAVPAGSNGGLGVCANYPTVFPYLGTTTPTLETYHIATTTGDASTLTEANTNAMIKLVMDGTGKPFFAAAGPYFSPTSTTYSGDLGAAGPSYSSSVTNFSVNADGSVAFKVGGSMDDNGPVFTAFKRSTHTGTLQAKGVTLHYSVFKQ